MGYFRLKFVNLDVEGGRRPFTRMSKKHEVRLYNLGLNDGSGLRAVLVVYSVDPFQNVRCEFSPEEPL